MDLGMMLGRNPWKCCTLLTRPALPLLGHLDSLLPAQERGFHSSLTPRGMTMLLLQHFLVLLSLLPPALVLVSTALFTG